MTGGNTLPDNLDPGDAQNRTIADDDAGDALNLRSEIRNAAEGLLVDEDGFVISGTRSNLFAVTGGRLSTPDLSASGVAGVQRDRVIAWAEQHGVQCTVARLRLGDLLQADEIFLVNSVFGLWPVARVQEKDFDQRQMSLAIQTWLNDAKN